MLSIQNYMEKNNYDELIVEDDVEGVAAGKNLTAQRVVKTKVKFDPIKIKQNLSSQKWRKCIDCSFIISESGLKTFLKNHPDLRDEMKAIVNRQEVFVEKKLDVLFDRGEVTLNELDGCYSIDEVPFVKIIQKKG